MTEVQRLMFRLNASAKIRYAEFMLKYVFVCVIGMGFLYSCSSAPPATLNRRESQMQFTYSRLKLLDLEEMTSLVEEKIDNYRETENLQPLQDAILITLGRPNEDNLSGRLLGNLKTAIGSDEVWQRVLKNVIDKSIRSLNDEGTAAVDQVTYLFILQTWLSEFKPELAKPDVDTRFEQLLVKNISEAQIKVSDAASREARLNLMVRLESPSLIAQDLLEEHHKRLNPDAVK